MVQFVHSLHWLEENAVFIKSVLCKNARTLKMSTFYKHICDIYISQKIESCFDQFLDNTCHHSLFFSSWTLCRARSITVGLFYARSNIGLRVFILFFSLYRQYPKNNKKGYTLNVVLVSKCTHVHSYSVYF